MARLRREDGEGVWAVAVARSAAERDRLRAEGRLLAELGHPGLVELGQHRTGEEADELLTGWVAGGSLAQARPLAVEEIAGVMAAVATTLADLHQAGWVHGAVEPAHVLLHPDGRPVLCGLGTAGRRGDPGPDGDPLDPAADVLALGELARVLLARAGDGTSGARAALESLADAACHPTPNQRPSARAVAAATVHGVPGARLPIPSREPPSPAVTPAAVPPASPLRGPEAAIDALAGLRAAVEPRRRRRPAGTTLVGSGALLAGLLALGLALRPPSATGGPAHAPVTSAAVTTSSVSSVRVAGVPVHLDGDVVVAGRHRYAVGRPGDRVLLGDWDCDGQTTVALARPTTGQVFRFDRFASPGHELSGELVARVPAVDIGRDLRVEATHEGCMVLVVTLPDGDRRRLALHPAAEAHT